MNISTGAYSDLARPPLHEAALRRALVVPGGLWTDLRVVAETGSTNAAVAAAARAGAPEGLVIVAERQYWNMLELLAQLGMFTPVPEG